MTVIRVRLCDADLKDYAKEHGEHLPEELPLDVDALLDLPAGELEAIERDLEMPIAVFIDAMQTRSLAGAQMRRVTAWLALRRSGRTVAYDDFQPRLLRATFTREADANPPAGPSEASSEA